MKNLFISIFILLVAENSFSQSVTLTPSNQQLNGKTSLNLSANGIKSLIIDNNGSPILQRRLFIIHDPAGLNIGTSSAGIWFNNFDNTFNESFVGMKTTTQVGIYGRGTAQWGLFMNTTNGNVAIGNDITTPLAKLHVDGDFALSGITTSNANGGFTAFNRQGKSIINFTGVGITQTVRGIAGGVEGMILYFLKDDAVTLTLVNEDITAPVGNRIYTHTGVDFTSLGGGNPVNRLGGITLIYIGDHWRVVSVAE